MLKKIFLTLLFISSVIPAQFQFGEVKGLFMAVGVGPRIPISDFSDKSNIGVGFDVTFSYSDNLLMPFFIYGNLGYQHYPGRQDLYKKSDYSAFSSNVLLFQPGVRYYFPPILENVVLLMPVVDAGVEFALFENHNQFKIDRPRSSYVDQYGKFGFHAGVGISMFLLDVVTYYNYFPDHEFISFVMKVNIPIFVSI
jgi:hypothetical protein